MKKQVTLTLLFCSIIFWVGGGVIAQDAVEPCSPDDIEARVDEIYSTYKVARSIANDTESSLNEVEWLQEAISALTDECEGSATAPAQTVNGDPGSGTMNDPYIFGIAGDTGEGFSLQLNRYIRPADTIIRSKNSFNDRPDADEVYIIIGGIMECYESTQSSCEITEFDFQMVGDMGIFYEVPTIVYYDDYILDLEVLGGVTIAWDMPYLVKKDDTNLRLIYRENSYEDARTVFAVQPSLENGIEVTAANNLNVRGGPGTNFEVVNNLSPNTPVVAFGRNADGTWVQISSGWLFAELLTIDGDAMSLPVLSQ